MSYKNTLIYVGEDGKTEVRELTEEYKPEGSQSLVQVKYSGINPTDLKQSFIKMANSVGGFDMAGTVIATGPESPFQIGDNVMGCNLPSPGKPLYLGAHQDYAIAGSHLFARLPPSVDMKGAGVAPAVFLTAIDALFNTLGFALPGVLDGTDAKDHPILIWGGAGSVGSAAIQLAKTAGFHPILTTASAKNHPALLGLGATQCFDYHDADVVDQILAAAATRGIALTTVFDAICAGVMATDPAAQARSSYALARRCVSPTADDLQLCGVGRVSWDPRYKFVLGTRPLGAEVFGGPQDPSWPTRSATAFKWVAERLGTAFVMPNVTVVKGTDAAVEGLWRVFKGGVSMEKIAIEHPF